MEQVGVDCSFTTSTTALGIFFVSLSKIILKNGENAKCILASAVVRRDCNRQKHFGRGSAKNLLTICYFLEKGRMSKHGIMAGHNFFRRNSNPSHLQQSGKDESDKKFSWSIFIQEKSFRIRYQNEGKESHRR